MNIYFLDSGYHIVLFNYFQIHQIYYNKVISLQAVVFVFCVNNIVRACVTVNNQSATNMSDTPKQRRGRKRSTLTRYLNSLGRHASEEDVEALQQDLVKAKEVFSELEVVHYELHDVLESSEEIKESEQWFDSVLCEYMNIISGAKGVIKATETPKDKQENSVKNPYDLVTLLNTPKLKIDTFTGNPAEYKTFIGIFDEIVDNTSLTDQAKLTRLLQCTAGEAKLAIKSCALIGGKEGYTKALDTLKTRFGDPILISRAVIDNLISDKTVSVKDLVNLSDEISIAFTTLKQLNMLSEVNTQKSILSIVK